MPRLSENNDYVKVPKAKIREILGKIDEMEKTLRGEA